MVGRGLFVAIAAAASLAARAQGPEPPQCPAAAALDPRADSGAAVTQFLVGRLAGLQRSEGMRAGGALDMPHVDAVLRDLLYWLAAPEYQPPVAAFRTLFKFYPFIADTRPGSPGEFKCPWRFT
jgi:hypothetical protein